MGSYMMRFGNRIVRYGERGETKEYDEAGKQAKKGLAVIMEAIEGNDLEAAKDGMEMAWEGVKRMCEISKEMKQQYGERRYDSRSYNGRGGMSNRDDDWNERDDQWMERRVRDSRGRYM